MFKYEPISACGNIRYNVIALRLYSFVAIYIITITE